MSENIRNVYLLQLVQSERRKKIDNEECKQQLERRVNFYQKKMSENIRNVYFCKTKQLKTNAKVYFGKLLTT